MYVYNEEYRSSGMKWLLERSITSTLFMINQTRLSLLWMMTCNWYRCTVWQCQLILLLTLFTKQKQVWAACMRVFMHYWYCFVLTVHKHFDEPTPQKEQIQSCLYRFKRRCRFSYMHLVRHDHDHAWLYSMHHENLHRLLNLYKQLWICSFWGVGSSKCLCTVKTKQYQ